MHICKCCGSLIPAEDVYCMFCGRKQESEKGYGRTSYRFLIKPEGQLLYLGYSSLKKKNNTPGRML